MDIFEKRRLALREYILKNKEKVANDIIEMRKKSSGISINEYIDNISKPKTAKGTNYLLNVP